MRRDQLRNVPFRSGAAPHAGLWLDKYLNGDSEQAKADLVGQVADLKPSPLYADFITKWKQHLTQIVIPLEEAELVTGMFKTKGRLVIGLGGAGVLETSITLHRTYGVPYLPGSALKGLASSYAHRKLDGDHWKKANGDNPQGNNYVTLFGNTEAAGYVTFLDALPLEYTIHRDVLTPHHTDYNSGGDAPPADWDNPIPVPFLSCSGTFLVAVIAPREWKETVLEILKLALAEEGIGAKTSSGYGRIVQTQETPNPLNRMSEGDVQAEGIRADVLNPQFLFAQVPRSLAIRLIACDCTPELKQEIAGFMLQVLQNTNNGQWDTQDWYVNLNTLVKAP